MRLRSHLIHLVCTMLFVPWAIIWLLSWLKVKSDGIKPSKPKARAGQWTDRQDENHVWALSTAKKWYLSDAVIIDTETTGLGKEDEIVEIAAIDMTGRVLIDQLVRPRVEIAPEAVAVHGISHDSLLDAPRIEEVAPALADIVRDRLVLSYNFEFDKRLLRQSLKSAGQPWRNGWEEFRGPHLDHCIMLLYGRYISGSSRRWVGLDKAAADAGIELEGQPHRAAYDAEKARRLLAYIAGQKE